MSARARAQVPLPGCHTPLALLGAACSPARRAAHAPGGAWNRGVRAKGDAARLYGTFTGIDGAATDATVARLRVVTPAGVVSSVTYPGTVTKAGTGSYYYDQSFSVAGDWQWWWEFEVSGAIVAVSERTIERVQALPV